MAGKLMKIASLWQNNSANAGDYFSGIVGNIAPGVEITKGKKLYIFRNREPNQDKSPTHFLFIEKPESDPEEYKKEHTTRPPKDEEQEFK